jgi:hypothetical protein
MELAELDDWQPLDMQAGAAVAAHQCKPPAPLYAVISGQQDPLFVVVVM